MVDPKDADNSPVLPNLGALNLMDPEEGEKNDRMGFIRKVYGILSA